MFPQIILQEYFLTVPKDAEQNEVKAIVDSNEIAQKAIEGKRL